MHAFELHPRLAADTCFVADWDLSRVLLMNDSRFAWLILVPRRAGVSELFELPAGDRALLMDEIARAADGLKRLTAAGKINIGALGNLVPQLHIHVIARKADDAAWPGPVWGYGRPVPYDDPLRTRLLGDLRSALSSPVARFVNAP